MSLHMLMERAGVYEGLFTFSTLELLHTSMSWNVGRQVTVNTAWGAG